jgi:hypothetical protein
VLVLLVLGEGGEGGSFWSVPLGDGGGNFCSASPGGAKAGEIDLLMEGASVRAMEGGSLGGEGLRAIFLGDGFLPRAMF